MQLPHRNASTAKLPCTAQQLTTNASILNHHQWHSSSTAICSDFLSVFQTKFKFQTKFMSPELLQAPHGTTACSQYLIQCCCLTTMLKSLITIREFLPLINLLLAKLFAMSWSNNPSNCYSNSASTISDHSLLLSSINYLQLQFYMWNFTDAHNL